MALDPCPGGQLAADSTPPNSVRVAPLIQVVPSLRMIAASTLIAAAPTLCGPQIIVKWLAATLLFAGLIRLGSFRLSRRLSRVVVFASVAAWMGFICLMALEIPTLPGRRLVGLAAMVSYLAGVLGLIIEFRAELIRTELPELARTWAMSAKIWGAFSLLSLAVWIYLSFIREGGGSILQVQSGMLFFSLLVLVLVPPVYFLHAVISTARAVKVPLGICKNCGYDLHGMLTPKCPECGAAFDIEVASRAPIADVRHDGWRSRAVAAAAMAGLVAGAAYFQRPGNTLALYKPFGLLMRDAVGIAERGEESRIDVWMRGMQSIDGMPAQRPPRIGAAEAQDELLRRLESGLLGKEQVAEVIRTALRVQADPQLPMVKWARLFEVADVAGEVDAEDRRRFFLGCLHFRLHPRTKVPVGMAPAFDIVAIWRGPSHEVPGPLPRFSEATQSVNLTVVSITANGVPIGTAIGPRRWSRSSSSEICSWGFTSTELAALTQIGQADLKAHVLAEWVARGSFDWKSETEMKQAGLPLSWNIQLASSAEVVPAVADAVRTQRGLPSAPRLNKWLDFSCNTRGVFDVNWRPGPDPELNSDYAFEVFVKVDNGRELVGSFVLSRRSYPTVRIALSPGQLERVRSLPNHRITLIFVPSAEVAARSIEIDQIWIGDEIELEIDVPQQ